MRLYGQKRAEHRRKEKESERENIPIAMSNSSGFLREAVVVIAGACRGIIYPPELYTSLNFCPDIEILIYLEFKCSHYSK